MLRAKKPKSIVGLDIEAGSAAAAEVRVNGSVEVIRHGVIELQPGSFGEGEVIDAQALGAALKELFARDELSRDVRLGIANQRVAVRVMRLPALEGDELESAIRFQAQDHIPMPLDQAVLDWQVIDRGEGEEGHGYVEVVAVAARRDMLMAMLDALRRAGLRPVGIDHSAFAMIRALGGGDHGAEATAVPALPPGIGETPAPEEPVAPAAGKLYCNLADTINLAVAHRNDCLFTRISPFGVEAIAQRLAERQQLALDDALELMVRVGLEGELDPADPEPERAAAAREALVEGAAKLADELRMSLDFYAAQDGAIPVEGVVACGRGTMIPGLVPRLQEEIGRPFEIARPAPFGDLDQLTAARLTLPYGLALEE